MRMRSDCFRDAPVAAQIALFNVLGFDLGSPESGDMCYQSKKLRKDGLIAV